MIINKKSIANIINGVKLNAFPKEWDQDLSACNSEEKNKNPNWKEVKKFYGMITIRKQNYIIYKKLAEPT